MKIITGIYGGRRFDAPKNLPARPTTDVAKQALFNILENRLDFEGAHCLDLFAGTGSISFEMLSRGAAQVTAVEMGRIQQQFILKVAGELQIPRGQLNLIRGDVFRYLKAANPGFDLVFADPPYALPELATLPDLVLPLLGPDTLFILEHGKENDFTEHPNFVEIRTYGAVHFSFFAQK